MYIGGEVVVTMGKMGHRQHSGRVLKACTPDAGSFLAVSEGWTVEIEGGPFRLAKVN